MPPKKYLRSAARSRTSSRSTPGASCSRCFWSAGPRTSGTACALSDKAYAGPQACRVLDSFPERGGIPTAAGPPACPGGGGCSRLRARAAAAAPPPV
eukprot:5595637-Alexandrium_andersonii.AAC.1